MDFFENILYFIIAMFAMKYFNLAINKAEDTKTTPKVRNISRAIVIIVSLIAIVSLSIYSILATEVGLTRRVIAGMVTFAMLIYFIYLIRKYIKTK